MSTETKIDWNKPLQTVRGWKVEQDDGHFWKLTFPNGESESWYYEPDDNGKLGNDGLPHGENPYDLMNVPEPEPAPDPVEALRAEVAELRERLAKIEAEKQAEDVAVPGGVDWSKPLETMSGVAVYFVGNSDRVDREKYPYLVKHSDDGIVRTYMQSGKFINDEEPHGACEFDLRNVVST